MPTYDYECRVCGHKFELFQSITDRPRRKCPDCGRSTAERLIGAGGGLIFKGSGFYVTDHRNKDFKEKAKQESQTPAKETESSKPKETETKTADVDS